MDEEAELQAKIAAIAGKINEHKQQQHPYPPNTPPYRPTSYTPRAYYSRGRWAPYGRGGRAAYPPYTNRTLVLSGAQASPPRSLAPNPSTTAPSGPSSPEATFVSARAPGRQQLMNQSTYVREQKQLLEYRDSIRAEKRQKQNRQEQNTLLHHLNASASSESREIIVDGLRFQLREDGSKLTRIHDPNTYHRPTPKKFVLANVEFCRTKDGNLVRLNAVRDLLKTRIPPQCEHFTKHGTKSLLYRPRARTRFSRPGNCPFGATCKFSHDPNKVAMCKTFLHTGACPALDTCDLSHLPTYHRVPACTHFLRGNCINDACPYPHLHVSETAPVCRSFSNLSYCPQGEDCPKRHLFNVCADHANHGKCDNPKCSLPHPDHAAILRKAAARQAKTGSEDESDVSSDEEMRDDDDAARVEDVDSDAAEEIMGAIENDHALSQQKDFVSFA